MNIVGVHGYYKAAKAAEGLAGSARVAAEFRERDQARASMIASRTVMPDSVPAKIRKQATDESIADQCGLPGMSIMKRIHCLKYQVGAANSPARRHILTDDGNPLGTHHRYRSCLKCKYWLTEEEWKVARQMLEACGGWDEFQIAAKARGKKAARPKRAPRREAA